MQSTTISNDDKTLDYIKSSLPRADLAVTPLQLDTFLLALDPSESLLSPFGRKRLIDATAKDADGNIRLADFVDWIYRRSDTCSIPNTIGSAESIRIFWSGHQTEPFRKYRTEEWGPGMCGESYDENSLSIKASMPPFNNSNNLPLPNTLIEYNVPCFGPKIKFAIMEIFNTAEMRDLSAAVNIPIPQYKLDSFIQGKMKKVHDMIAAARKREDCVGNNKIALDRMEAFTRAFEALQAQDVTCPEDWTRFVNSHVSPGWEHRLHFDHLLSNFDYADDSAKELRRTKFIDSDGKEVTLENHGCRWLSKAFSAYGPKGCLTDVVNLIFAMGKYIPVGDEKQIIEFIQDFHGKLQRFEFHELWVPTHYAHDAESDDLLCWLLLEYVHKKVGTSLEVLVQLSTDDEMDELVALFESNCKCTIFRDPEARNCKQVMNAFPALFQKG